MEQKNVLAPFPPQAGWIAGARIMQVLGDEARNFYVVELPPGHRSQAHYHRHSSQIYLIVAGNGLLLTSEDGEQVMATRLGRGDLIQVTAGLAHQLVNDGTAPLRLLLACDMSQLENDRTPVDDLTGRSQPHASEETGP